MSFTYFFKFLSGIEDTTFRGLALDTFSSENAYRCWVWSELIPNPGRFQHTRRWTNSRDTATQNVTLEVFFSLLQNVQNYGDMFRQAGQLQGMCLLWSVRDSGGMTDELHDLHWVVCSRVTWNFLMKDQLVETCRRFSVKVYTTTVVRTE